jgi:hypothetical protein
VRNLLKTKNPVVSGFGISACPSRKRNLTRQLSGAGLKLQIRGFNFNNAGTVSWIAGCYGAKQMPR